MLLLVIAAAALGTMPVPQFAPKILDRSSGSAALDQAGCTAVTGLVRPVVRDASGTPIRAISRVSVGFATSAVSPK